MEITSKETAPGWLGTVYGRTSCQGSCQGSPLALEQTEGSPACKVLPLQKET